VYWGHGIVGLLGMATIVATLSDGGGWFVGIWDGNRVGNRGTGFDGDCGLGLAA